MLSPDKLTFAANAELIGTPGSAAQLTTPALVLELERFRANQAQMMSLCAAAGIKLRPHGKTHKCSRLASHVTLNAGFKSFATDGPLPELHGEAFAGARYELYGDEYGRLVLGPGQCAPRIGTCVELVTPHCDPTVNLHDQLHVIEGNTLVDIWRIDARGVL